MTSPHSNKQNKVARHLSVVGSFQFTVTSKFRKMNIKPAFSFSIDMKLSERGVAIGKYDGQNASLTAITQSNKASENSQ